MGEETEEDMSSSAVPDTSESWQETEHMPQEVPSVQHFVCGEKLGFFFF